MHLGNLGEQIVLKSKAAFEKISFVERVDELLHESRRESRLKAYRMRLGLSQSELAKKSDIPVRTIQQYEQRQKNINKAQVDYLVRLAKCLYCELEDLME